MLSEIAINQLYEQVRKSDAVKLFDLSYESDSEYIKFSYLPNEGYDFQIDLDRNFGRFKITYSPGEFFHEEDTEISKREEIFEIFNSWISNIEKILKANPAFINLNERVSALEEKIDTIINERDIKDEPFDFNEIRIMQERIASVEKQIIEIKNQTSGTADEKIKEKDNIHKEMEKFRSTLYFQNKDTWWRNFLRGVYSLGNNIREVSIIENAISFTNETTKLLDPNNTKD